MLSSVVWLPSQQSMLFLKCYKFAGQGIYCFMGFLSIVTFNLTHVLLLVNQCSNYQGKSLLSTTFKILSNILLSRLIPYAEEIAVDHQCGY